MPGARLLGAQDDDRAIQAWLEELKRGLVGDAFER
jgi:hypothetical protein